MLCETFNRIVESRATVSGACAKVEKSLASNSSGSGPFFSRVGTMDDLQRIRPGRPRFCPFGGADLWFSNSQRKFGAFYAVLQTPIPTLHFGPTRMYGGAFFV
jgi:hypothetical protein